MNKKDLPPVICQEECAEVIQAISKIFRFGMDNTNLERKTNKQHLESEVGQLLFSIEQLSEHWKLNTKSVARAYDNKKATYKQWESYFPESK
jgi:hypothetical protein